LWTNNEIGREDGQNVKNDAGERTTASIEGVVTQSAQEVCEEGSDISKERT
jgi:hypothetical protein